VPTFHTEFGPESEPQTLGEIAERVFSCHLGASLSVKALALLPPSFPSPPLCHSAPPRTLAKHQNGISRPEHVRLSAAGYLIAKRGPAIWVTLASNGYDTAELRRRGDRLKNTVVTFQRRNGVPAYWADTLETKPRPHLHAIAAAPIGKAKRMCKAIESSNVLGDVKAKSVHDMPGLVGYLSKERTTEAAFADGYRTRRIRGSHKLPDSGDRQRVSRELRNALIGEGLVDDWTKTNARRVARIINADVTNQVERATFGLFFADDLHVTRAPPKAKREPQRREKIPPPSLQMDYPPSIVDMVAELRKRKTCEQIGELAGLSRQQLNNVAVDRFDIGRKARERIVELARAA
jgi:hypothetical protein